MKTSARSARGTRLVGGLANEVLPRLRRHPGLYWKIRNARTAAGRLLPPRTYPELLGRVHPNDSLMFTRTAAGRRAYADAGLSAVRGIEAGLTAAGRSWSTVGSMLDFGCGYGRVGRWLSLYLPPQRVTVTDVDDAAVAFCRREFGFAGFTVSTELAGSTLGRYDLVWAGSVFTHLPHEQGSELAAHLVAAIEPGGVLVFSTQGERSLEVSDAADDVRAEFVSNGSSYRPYAHYDGDDYGLTWHTEAYVDTMLALDEPIERVMFAPAAWVTTRISTPSSDPPPDPSRRGPACVGGRPARPRSVRRVQGPFD